MNNKSKKNKQRWEVHWSTKVKSDQVPQIVFMRRVFGKGSRGKWIGLGLTEAQAIPADMLLYLLHAPDPAQGRWMPQDDFKESFPTMERLREKAQDAQWIDPWRCIIEVECKITADLDRLAVPASTRKLKAALKKLDDGRNEGCWPVISFGGKNADLEPSGCSGIKELRVLKNGMVVFEVGGHKTTSHPNEWGIDGVSEKLVEQVGDVIQEMVCGTGFDGEWDGDSWVSYFRETAQARLRKSPKDGKLLWQETARAVEKKAQRLCKPFWREMEWLDKACNEEYQRLEKIGKSNMKRTETRRKTHAEEVR